MKARILKLNKKVSKKLILLKKGAEKDGIYRVAKRIHAILLNSGGKTSGDISHLLHVPRSCVTEWLKNFENHGVEGLLEGQRSGRPSCLTKKQASELGDIIESGPVAYGFISGVWTSIMITEVIAEEFSIFYHPGHVRKFLYKMGFSVQRPKKILTEADPEKQNKWKRVTYPNIKKKQKLTAQL